MIDFIIFLIANFLLFWMSQMSQAGVRNKHMESQLTFTCSKTTIETLEKGVKYVQS